MSTERDELLKTISGTRHMWALHLEVPADMVDHVANGIADAILAAGYRRIDHTEYALDHKRADLQFTDDDGELWTDEYDVKDYASEYGDTAPLVKRHVTAWEATK